MQVTEQDLRERYESMETEQLIELQARGGLTEIATRVVEQVLAGRSVSTAERVAVVAEIKQRVVEQEAMQSAFASPEVRIGAKLIDFVVSQAIMLLSFLLLKVSMPLATVGLVLSVAYLFLADGFPRGQSVGKRLLGIAVIDQVTKNPCTYPKSVVRNLLLWLLGIVDWLFVLGRTRQRLGDKLVATVVVNVKRKAAAAEW
jgi:uncharacterized RDD family membrane protein YckC